MSFQETAWGTKILKKLERIHTNVDPDRLFNCWGGVEYIKEVKIIKATKAAKGSKGSQRK